MALPGDLSGQTVVLDCRDIAVSTPSFLDEIVKVVLVERGAALLEVVDADERAQSHVSRAAQNRQVSDRVRTALRI